MLLPTVLFTPTPRSPMTRAFLQILTAGGCLAACAIGPAVAADISGAGATFPFPIYAKWADAYKKETGIEVTYRPVGSGDGIRQIQAKEVTFGASDMPLNGADLELHGLVQFPTVVGGIVAVVNIEGIKTGDLTLDGPTLARIFLGEIKSWNDAALRKLNPSVKLPSQAITVVRRSDGSGTTFAFTDYLSKVSLRLEDPGRIDHLHRLAGRNRRRGQRGRGRHRCPHQGSDRICRIRLCQAEQARLHHAHEQGRQGRCARASHRSRPRPQRELGSKPRLRRDPDPRIRRRDLADHRGPRSCSCTSSRPIRWPRARR